VARPFRPSALGAFALVGALALPALARADIVFLKDGRELEGTVTEETDTIVKLKVVRGKGTAILELARSDVRFVRKEGPDLAKLEAEAQEALGLGNRADALRILRSLVAEKPDEGRLRRELAFAELLSDDLEHARDDYARATALDPVDLEAWCGLGYTRGHTGDRDGAIDAYRQATRVGPQHGKSWRFLATLLLERNGRGDREESILAAKRALAISAADGEATLLAAEGLARAQGLGSDAERKSARELLEIFLHDNARDAFAPKIARRAAELSYLAGDAARAKATIGIVIAARPPITDEERERLLALDSLYGWIADKRPAPALGLDAGSPGLDVEAAARRLDLALEALPQDGDLLLLRARLLARRGRTADAREAARRAIAVLPAGATKDDAVLLEEALAPRDDATKPEPLTETRARRLVALLPLDWTAHESLGRTLEATGDLAGARDALGRARELAPEAEKKRLGAEESRVEKLRAMREKNKDL
jgi:Flp pilus assembly protein TadD